MGQKLRNDKIGVLSHSAGTISMAASASNPAFLSIGGQQYRITANLTVAVGTATAATRYQIYATASGGVVTLQKSTAENSTGPGTASWKLIGSFYAGAANTFGAFVSIVGVPEAFGINVASSTTWTGFTATDSRVLMDIRGSKARFQAWVETSALVATPTTLIFPSGITLRTTAYESAHDHLGLWSRMNGNWMAAGDGGAMTFVSGQGSDRMCFTVTGAGDNFNTLNGNGGSWSTGESLSLWFEFETNELSNTPISER